MSVQRSSRYRVADDEEASMSRGADEPSLPSELGAAPGEQQQQQHRTHSPSVSLCDRGGDGGGSVSGHGAMPRAHYQAPQGHMQLRVSQPSSPASVVRPTLSRPPSYSLSAAPHLPVFHDDGSGGGGSPRSSFSVTLAHHDAHAEEARRARADAPVGRRSSPAPSPRLRPATPTLAAAPVPAAPVPAAPVPAAEAKPPDAASLHATHVPHRTPHIAVDTAVAPHTAIGSGQVNATAATAAAAALPISAAPASAIAVPAASPVPPSPRSNVVPAPVAVRLSSGFSIPPPMARPHSATPTPSASPHSSSSSLSWVSQTNRELVRILFGKRMTTHRGILESPFQSMQDQPAANVAPSPKKHSRSLSLSKASFFSSSSSSSAAIPPALVAQQQLLHASMLRFHIALVGVANSGKTSTAHNLTGRAVPPKHMETSGMHIIDLAWPYKTADGGVYMCDLLLWDSGFTSAAQYKYIQTTPESHAHLLLYFVSSVDRNSWMLVQRRLEEDASKPFAKLLVLTKIDDRSKREVQEADILAFQDKYNRAHYPGACSPTGAGSSIAGPLSPPPLRSYSPGSLVVCKIANWPLSNEPFYTRPGVTSLLNTISAMCIASQPTR